MNLIILCFAILAPLLGNTEEQEIFNNKPVSIHWLPNETLKEIFIYLDLKSLNQAKLVQRSWNDLIKSLNLDLPAQTGNLPLYKSILEAEDPDSISRLKKIQREYGLNHGLTKQVSLRDFVQSGILRDIFPRQATDEFTITDLTSSGKAQSHTLSGIWFPPQALEQLRACTSLHLQLPLPQGLCYFPEELSELTSLKQLWVGPLMSTTDPMKASLGKRTKLYPREAFNINNQTFKHINWLALQAGLTHLPKAMGSLEHLTCLDLSGNHFQSLPDLGNLTNLNTLILKDNPIKELPSWVSKLTQLTGLNASNLSLTWLPDLSNLNRLQILALNKNNFGAWPEDKVPQEMYKIFSSGMDSADDPAVRLLNAKFKLERSQDQATFYRLRTLIQLQNLELNFCGLESVTSDIDNLKLLQILSLRNNNIKKVFHNILIMDSLVHLDLFSNTKLGLPNNHNLNKIVAACYTRPLGINGRPNGAWQRTEGIVNTGLSQQYTELSPPPIKRLEENNKKS